MIAIPKKLRIGTSTYKINEISDLRDVAPMGGHLAWGCIDFTHCVIRLYKDMPLDKKWAVLIHEMVHGIDEAVGLDLDEENTDRLAVCLADTLTRNKIGLV